MQATVTVTPMQLPELLLHVAVVRSHLRASSDDWLKWAAANGIHPANGAPALPTWFLVEVGRDVPRLMAARS
ncbi:hypothetical protein [Nonomuraea sp. NEAU-A123]|uniref:hypothetical protein n=1 Tax=Nonomuraea sp. NEAU-A123 TaxID=2839649 RepID=UPI001BE4120A|nr:hypothetical protein [Nonomuraea sp. NEAU-A123]MBT2235236.1 hypothetical protein [Nonomuraea sp. NEAU-A123]